MMARALHDVRESEYTMRSQRGFDSMGGGAPERGRLDPALLAAWMDGVTRGETSAFDALFNAFYTPLCAFARGYVRSPQAAEELVEDLFLKLWTDRERLDVRGSVASYLYVAVRHRAMNHLTRLRLERKHAETALAEERWGARHAVNDAEDRMREDELYASVREAVDELPPRGRQAYLLYYQHHLSYAEIAAVMGIAPKTVENQLARSLKTLWLRLKDVLE